jgi:hypothetical protein
VYDQSYLKKSGQLWKLGLGMAVVLAGGTLAAGSASFWLEQHWASSVWCGVPSR